MNDYNELVKSLRICAIWKDEIRFPGKDGCNGCAYHDEERDVCTSWDTDKLREHIMLDAADAIEELQRVANKLLAKYQEEATSVIWEYSGNIERSIDLLNEEVRTLSAQIDGISLPEPPKEETE